MSEYPDGVCEYCGKVFPRPNKYRTEKESSHVKDCELESIKNIINSRDYEWIAYELIDELKSISKRSSFGARPGNRHYERMLECKSLIKKLNETFGER